MKHQSQHPPRLVFAVLVGAPFLAALDLFVVNVALPEVSASFSDSRLADVSWVLNGYAIVYAALLVPVGRLADRLGPRAVFLAGLSLFTLASAAAAASWQLWVLVAWRLVQAAGAAALTPTSLALLLQVTPPDRRMGAVRAWTALGACAAALGPVLGGMLVVESWRWIFLINVPIGVALLLPAVLSLPAAESPHERSSSLDPVGVVLLASGIGAFALALVRGPEWGWGSDASLLTFLVAGGSTGLFARHALHHPDPLVPPGLLRIPGFAWANVTALLFAATFAAGLLEIVLLLQAVWGYGALRTGLALAPGPLAVPVVAIGGQRWTSRWSPGPLAACGAILWAAGMLMLFGTAGIHPAYVTVVLPGWVICGVGVGLTLPTVLASATVALPPALRATGSGLVNMARQVGTALGVSVLVAVLAAPVGHAETHAAYLRAGVVIAALGIVAAGTATRIRLPTTMERAPGLAIRRH
jgi:EmrB/QacA subfamily drug resistance transporter